MSERFLAARDPHRSGLNNEAIYCWKLSGVCHTMNSLMGAFALVPEGAALPMNVGEDMIMASDREPAVSPIRRFIHVNVVCSDLQTSLDFYVGALGGTVHEQFDSAGSDLRPSMGVSRAGARNYKAALVYWGDAQGGPYIDLLEWYGTRAGGAPRAPLTAQDFGLVRVALEVDDVQSWHDHLTAIGVHVVGPIQEEKVGPWILRILLCMDPDGTLIELVEFPYGQRRQRS